MPSREQFVPLKIAPGVFKNGTRYQAKGRWYDANCLRWYEGIMGPIGGWTNVQDATKKVNMQAGDEAGTATGAQSSTTLKDTSKTWTVSQWAGYVVQTTSGTGLGQTRTIVDNTADTLTVTPAWTVTPVTADTRYTIGGRPRGSLGWRNNSKTSFLAVGTSKKLWRYSNGAILDITPAGLVTGRVDGAYAAGGYGSGAYGAGAYGVDAGALTLNHADTWQLDNYGELLVACLTSDGKLYKSDFVSNTATQIPGSPTGCAGLVVTPERFLVALGGDSDAREARWALQESALTNANDWTIDGITSAGSFSISSKGRLVAGRRTRRQTLLWTDVDVYAMTFVAGDAVYAFEQLGDNCGLVAPNAMVVLGDIAFWMSYGKFFVYDSALKPLQCDVLDFVFQDLNLQQRAKVTCVANALFDEVIWFYPSNTQVGALENDKYVAFNYRENHWTIGTLGRDTGIDRGAFDLPLYLDRDGVIYQHEDGQNRSNAGAVFAESGPVEIADVSMQMSDSSAVMHVNRYIPDEKTLGDVRLTLKGSLWPTDTEKTVGPFAANSPTNTRFLARNVRVRVDEAVATLWRLGVPRIGVVPGGRR